MRILNLDGHYFVEPLKRMGHEVLSIGPLECSDIVLTETISLSSLLKIFDTEGFVPDIVIWADLCKPPSVIGIESLPCITVGYSIDQYCNPWHAPYSAAFDLMLVAQKDYLHIFESCTLGNEVEWAPLFCDPYKDKELGGTRDIPVSFVGTVEGSINYERKTFLDAFKQSHPIFVTQGNYVPIYNRSQIVLNQSAVGELNFRIFEAMACGAAVLTEETNNGLYELFSNGENILLYPRGIPQAAAAVAKAALANPELSELARNGRRKVLAEHSSIVRAKHILFRAEQIAAGGSTWRRQQAKIAHKTVATAYSMLAVDTELPLTQELRNFYALHAQKLLEQAKNMK